MGRHSTDCIPNTVCVSNAALGRSELQVRILANRPNGFFSANHGYEFNLVLAVVAVGVATMGPGKYSADWQLDLSFPFDPKVALAISAGLGLVAGIGLVVACWRPPAPAAPSGDAAAEDASSEDGPESVDAVPDASPSSSSDDA